MENKIPYELFEEYICLGKTHPKSQQEQVKYYNDLNKHFKSMENVLWEDIEKLGKEELERIPISWLYDWAHATANYEYQEQIAKLYDKYHLPKLSNNQFFNIYFRDKRKK